MCLLPRATLHNDSEHILHVVHGHGSVSPNFFQQFCFGWCEDLPVAENTASYPKISDDRKEKDNMSSSYKDTTKSGGAGHRQECDPDSHHVIIAMRNTSKKFCFVLFNELFHVLVRKSSRPNNPRYMANFFTSEFF